MATNCLQCRTIALPIANSIFIDGLKSAVLKQNIAIPPQTVIKVGPTNLRALTQVPRLLLKLKLSYLEGVKNSLYLALAAIFSALVFGLFMEWKCMEVAAKSESRDGSLALDNGQQLKSCPMLGYEVIWGIWYVG